MILSFLLTISYLIGSIPFGLLVTRLAGLGDVRNIGSGNIGATNVMRTGRKGLGLLTLLLDGGKGYAAIWLTGFTHSELYVALAGLLVVIGHIFPVWLNFKGGKGVATTIGVFFALDPVLGASVCTIWILAFVFMRISSLASLLGIGYSSIVAYLLGHDETTVLCLILAALIVFTHRGNITRLLQGTEHSFNRKDS